MPIPNSQQMAAGQPVVAQGNTTTTQVDQVIESLKKVIQQAIDPNGYVDLKRLVQLWPQFSQIPFQVVMQLIQQNPEILENLVTQYGLAGVIVNGRPISADEMAGMSSGGSTGGMR